MSKDTGGPAFPSLNAVCTGLDSDGGERWDTEPSGGMTLRDYFAAAALTGASASVPQLDNDQLALRMTAAIAYAIADAMLAERAK